MKILVIVENLRSTLASVRSLGRAGIQFGVCDTQSIALAGASQFCSERSVCPSPIDRAAGFQHFVLELSVNRGDDAALPISDVRVLSERVDLDKELVEQSARLLGGAGWSGPAMVGFKPSRLRSGEQFLCPRGRAPVWVAWMQYRRTRVGLVRAQTPQGGRA